MFILYDVATGNAISQSSIPIANVADGRAVKEVSGGGIWNPETLDMEPAPINKKITTLGFMSLFTDEEMIAILDAAKVNTRIQLFVMKMEQAEFIDLNYPPTIYGVNALEQMSLIAPGRAAEILNG